MDGLMGLLQTLPVKLNQLLLLLLSVDTPCSWSLIISSSDFGTGFTPDPHPDETLPFYLGLGPLSNWATVETAFLNFH